MLTSSQLESSTGLPSRINPNHRGKRRVRRLLQVFAGCVILFCAGLGWLYATPSGYQTREVLAEDILSSQHPWLARILLSPSDLTRIARQIFDPPSKNSKVPSLAVLPSTEIKSESQLILSTTLHRPHFTAYVLEITDPSAVHLATTRYSDKGEALSEILKDTGALAGINAGGFVDPGGDGSGGTPIGSVFSFGQQTHSVGAGVRELMAVLTANNGFAVGSFSDSELEQIHARDAVHFYPELIVDGKPMITEGDGGWGYAPRTAIGATASGKILLIVTNGRFIDGPWNLGASLRDVQDILLGYGAVNALNLDGGGSATMMVDGKLMNHPETDTAAGMRYLPNAFVVVPPKGLVEDGPGTLAPPADVSTP